MNKALSASLLIGWGSVLLIFGLDESPTTQTSIVASPTTAMPQPQETALSLITPSQESPVSAETTHPTYRVVKVIDGDTISVERDGQLQTIRLIGLDTPEVVDPRTVVQCFGEEASAYLRSLVEKQQVRLESDPLVGEQDRYNRRLRYVFLPDGTNVAKEMIGEGYGHEYTYKLPYQQQHAFRAAERQAREAKRGLWADDACQQPNQTIKKTTSGRTTSKQIEGDKDCTDFTSHAEAQAFFTANDPAADPHRLDSDKDGLVCESLP